MTPEQRREIVHHLEANRIMSIATLRPDGWPQTTIVGYASRGLWLYFACSRTSQKARNLAFDGRASLAIGRDAADPMMIEGLSMAARVLRVDDPDEIAEAIELMLGRYPEYRGMWRNLQLSEIALFRAVPVVVSVLDYRRGFGHCELVEVASDEV